MTTPTESASCSVTSIASILDSPLSYAGKHFCGDALIRRHDRTVRVVSRYDENPSLDLAIVLAPDNIHLLEGLGDTPRKYRIEAIIEPMEECFASELGRPVSDSGEECSPWRRPIFFRLLRATQPALRLVGSSARGNRGAGGSAGRDRQARAALARPADRSPQPAEDVALRSRNDLVSTCTREPDRCTEGPR